MKSDIQIARECQLKPIEEIAHQLHITDSELEPYGHYITYRCDFVRTFIEVYHLDPLSSASHDTYLLLSLIHIFGEMGGKSKFKAQPFCSVKSLLYFCTVKRDAEIAQLVEQLIRNE